ncbi:hypothetical protein ACKZDW_24105 [Ralstonia syzygii subsp. celebesensis]|uniref:Uncharacterized protein n=3 Tax=Ralstonia solanacearum species complex TaxID=3116862 RepID=A0AAD0SCQ7_RALSL|nr:MULTISPECIES: hypothetical protein [Ralstonia solanacearum species complex]CCA81841.1 conserved hypothethical protein [blood disease bacterium R229]BEU74723.1 hypothetical protein MAFF211271_42780 [Ralstonia pseudosolanacearum]AMP40137.1 hypothetical protein LBM2029_21465 [Ralstonia solanacearum]AQW31126.1 hypothetical protein B0B51_15065 [blood disease bacterium A2-HR MARDI]AXV79551.1 hypothetical protein CJO76_21820 [Ralstonia solanacearum]
MRHPDQHASSRSRHSHSDTARLLADTVAFHIDRGGRRIEATYSARNGIVTVSHQGKSLSTYSPEADHHTVARKLLSVMLTI